VTIRLYTPCYGERKDHVRLAAKEYDGSLRRNMMRLAAKKKRNIMRLAANVGLFYLIVRGVWLRSYTVRSLEGRASWRWRRGHRGGGGEGIVAVEARASWQWRRWGSGGC
jgi:hypothetical protein